MTTETSSGASGDARVLLEAAEVSRIVDGDLEGDPGRKVRDVAPVDEARDDELGFLASASYVNRLSGTRAGALLVSSALRDELADEPDAPETRIFVDDPHAVLPELLRRFHPPAPEEPGIHPTAVLGAGVRLGEGVRVGPYAVIEDGATLGARVRIGPHVVVGRGSRVGDDSVLHPQVVLYPGSQVGERVILHAGARIGVDGFGYATVEGDHRKIPQVGGCTVEDDVEIGANTAVDRGSIGSTRIARGAKLDNLVHLGHNVKVGRSSMLAAQVGVAGSTRIGSGVLCGGQAGINGHIEIGDGARIGGQGGVIGDLEPGATVTGFPARNHRDYFRGMALVLKLPDLLRRLRALEKQLEEE